MANTIRMGRRRGEAGVRRWFGDEENRAWRMRLTKIFAAGMYAGMERDWGSVDGVLRNRGAVIGPVSRKIPGSRD